VNVLIGSIKNVGVLCYLNNGNTFRKGDFIGKREIMFVTVIHVIYA